MLGIISYTLSRLAVGEQQKTPPIVPQNVPVTHDMEKLQIADNGTRDVEMNDVALFLEDILKTVEMEEVDGFDDNEDIDKEIKDLMDDMIDEVLKDDVGNGVIEGKDMEVKVVGKQKRSSEELKKLYDEAKQRADAIHKEKRHAQKRNAAPPQKKQKNAKKGRGLSYRLLSSPDNY